MCSIERQRKSTEIRRVGQTMWLRNPGWGSIEPNPPLEYAIKGQLRSELLPPLHWHALHLHVPESLKRMSEERLRFPRGWTRILKNPEWGSQMIIKDAGCIKFVSAIQSIEIIETTENDRPQASQSIPEHPRASQSSERNQSGRDEPNWFIKSIRKRRGRRLGGSARPKNPPASASIRQHRVENPQPSSKILQERSSPENPRKNLGSLSFFVPLCSQIRILALITWLPLPVCLYGAVSCK